MPMLLEVHETMVDDRDTVGKKRSGRLTQEEESALALAWRERGDPAARERLVEVNMGLVVAIARRYRSSGVTMDELIAEGNLGLLRAVDGFDPACGARFSTYAAYWIRQGISRAFAANSPRGRLGSKDRRDVMMLEKAVRQHYSVTGRQPTVAELADTLGWTTERVGACAALSRSFVRPFSMDEPQGDSERGVMQHAAPDVRPPRNSQEEVATDVTRLLAELSPLERSALEMRFGLNGTEPQGLDAIADALNCSRRETRIAMRTAMAKLAKKCKAVRTNTLRGGDGGAEPVWETMDREQN